MISKENVLIERIRLINDNNGLGLKTLIQLNTMNKKGIIDNITACFRYFENAKIPAVRNSIQKILSTTIKNEYLPKIGIKIKCITESRTNIPLNPLS